MISKGHLISDLLSHFTESFDKVSWESLVINQKKYRILHHTRQRNADKEGKQQDEIRS